MLQRAASNAYSWWWASHIRTKQSKWMEQNLQDMEEKVQYVLKLIEEDGDSFARRAEMYYKKRPELIQFVEESYRAYRALAERYDHLSTELQNANSTLASVFPEQVQFAMEDDDDESLTIAPKKAPAIPKANIPKVPNAPKELKRIFTSAPKRLQSKKSMKVTAAPVAKSGLNKSEGLQEIDKLQKQILALQTEKEFVKSSYEGSLAKYWQIEGEIEEMQKKVCSLQDEFGAGTVIEDSEARTLMASAALKSCQETLTQLQQKQEKSAEEAIVERKKINNAREKLKSLKKAFQHENNNEESPESNHEYAEAVKDLKNSDQEPSTDTQEKQDLELLRDKIRQHFDIGSNASLSVTELAEQIDKLVNKVINLEASVSSQTALIQRLRAETDDLQAQIGILEEDKVMLISGKNDLRDELRETEKKLHGLEELNKSVEDQNNNLQSHFAAAYQNLDHLNQKLHTMMPDEELQTTSQPELESSSGAHVQFIGQESALDPDGNRAEPHSMKQQVKIETSDSLQKEKARDEKTEHDLITSKTDNSEIVSLPWRSNEPDNPQEKSSDTKTEKKVDEQSSPKTPNSHLLVETQEQETKQEAEPDWKYLFTKGMENKEKLLLNEYTAVLRNFKDVKKQLAEVEKKNGDGLFELTVHVRELRSANAKKDELIRVLRQKLNLLQTGLGEDNESEKSCLTESSTIETDEDKLILMDQQEISQIEQKFRMSIDEVLEENLDFWLRFSTTFHQIQKFQTEIKDLQSELLKLEGKKQKQDGSSASKYNLKSDAKPLYKHLREIHTELSIWLETSVQLKDELKSRFSSLCNIQEEIIAALKDSAEDDDFKFTSYQAAKFQGEILNMKQENNKVADELQVGLDHVTTLQLEVEKALAKLNEEFKLSGSKHLENVQLEHSGSRARVPLRSFIFGVKQKKQKNSFFSCVHPVLQKKYNGFKAGINV